MVLVVGGGVRHNGWTVIAKGSCVLSHVSQDAGMRLVTGRMVPDILLFCRAAPEADDNDAERANFLLDLVVVELVQSRRRFDVFAVAAFVVVATRRDTRVTAHRGCCNKHTQPSLKCLFVCILRQVQPNKDRN